MRPTGLIPALVHALESSTHTIVRSNTDSSTLPRRGLERLAIFHAATLLLLATWGFGGGTASVRTALTYLGGSGIFLLVAHLRSERHRGSDIFRSLAGLAPLAGFNLLVLAGCFNPSFRELPYGAEPMLIPNQVSAWFPSSARPILALHDLALFNALFLPCFNLALIVRSRRLIRGLLLFVAANALVLSIFGTLQKLAHAPGLFFGRVKSPQPYFFSSFIYHNHWGAFALLAVTTCAGLAWYYARRGGYRDFFHSNAFSGLIALLLIAATIPLSGSRSSTLLLGGLLAGGFLHVLFDVFRGRQEGESIAGALVGIFAAAAVGLAAIFYVGSETIATRVAKTQEQIAAMQASGGIGSRATLYHDTWRMARERPVFGWGMASYPHVFQLYNTQTATADRLPVFYADAHSDWLQALAEHGFVGTVLIGLCALLPLAKLRARHLRHPLPNYLLCGCALVLLYAWIEFPFGNAAVVFTWWLCFFSAVRYARLDSGGSSPAT